MYHLYTHDHQILIFCFKFANVINYKKIISIFDCINSNIAYINTYIVKP